VSGGAEKLARLSGWRAEADSDLRLN